MHRSFPAIVAAFALLAGHAPAAEKPDDRAAAALRADAPIIVTINPEGRVSVKLGGAIPPPARPGAPVEWRVRVVNQGYATGRLMAQLVGDPAPPATLDFNPERLKGSPTEMRTLRITLANPAPTDLTIAFRLANETSDLGGRDQIHVLIRPL
jgi:hypothetical protein